MNKTSYRIITAWLLILLATAVTLLIAWLGHVPVATLLAVGTTVLSLSWLVVLATVPWNLYFAARRAAVEMAVSRERGVQVRPAYDQEAEQISSRMLRLAVGSHLGTAVVAAAIAYFSGNQIGYYIAGIFLISTGFRPAAAYFLHVRERIRVLSRESTHPRDDVATLHQEMATLEQKIQQLRADLRQSTDDLRRADAALGGNVEHLRQLLTADLNRLQEALVASQNSARTRTDELDRKIDQMFRRIEATLDGISDHQELLTGLRALVRMVRSDAV